MALLTGGPGSAAATFPVVLVEEALEVLEAAGLVEENEEPEEAEPTFLGAGVAEAFLEAETEAFLEEEEEAEAFLEEEPEAEAFLEGEEATVVVLAEEEVTAPPSLDFSASLMSLADPNAGMPYWALSASVNLAVLCFTLTDNAFFMRKKCFAFTKEKLINCIFSVMSKNQNCFIYLSVLFPSPQSFIYIQQCLSFITSSSR